MPLTDLIKEAYKYDLSLKATVEDLKLLEKKQLLSTSYSRETLFKCMHKGETVLFNNYPIKNDIPFGLDKRKFTLNVLRKTLRQKDKIYIRYGSKRTLKKVTISEALKRWERGRSKFGVTDLHFRGTNYFNVVDANSISYFNLLPSFSEDISFLEMLTLVISSKGIFSDSHSDDGDGNNHCIIGKKLWFAWDRNEGRKKGLKDCTYDAVYNQATFSLKKFASLKSAHWFIVSEGETLFMPGNFTHKVITLEPYIGFGSFYLSLPNYLNSLKRWILSHSSDVTNDYIEKLGAEFLMYLEHMLKNMTKEEKVLMGYEYFLKSIKSWQNGVTKNEKMIFEHKARLSELKRQLKLNG